MTDEIGGRSTTSMRHVAPLDGFRAVAILLVLISHAGLGSVVPGGFGVTIFFFLSGFLIMSLLRSELLKEGRISFKEFYIKRFYRIVPPLVGTICFCAFLLATGLIKAAGTPSGYALDLLFLSNYQKQFGSGPGLPMPLWSLNVEEHFYFVMPFVYVSLATTFRRQPIAFFVALCFIVLLLRIYNVFVLNVFEENYYWTHTRIDSIIFGCILALWNNPIIDGEKAWRPTTPQFFLAIVVLVLCVAIRSPIFRETIRYSLQGVALFVVFSFVIHSPDGHVGRFLSAAPLRRVALWSYTLYLVHNPLFLFVHQNFSELSSAMANSLALVLSVAFAMAMRALVEKPLLKARSRTLRKSRLNGFATP